MQSKETTVKVGANNSKKSNFKKKRTEDVSAVATIRYEGYDQSAAGIAVFAEKPGSRLTPEDLAGNGGKGEQFPGFYNQIHYHIDDASNPGRLDTSGGEMEVLQNTKEMRGKSDLEKNEKPVVGVKEKKKSR